jgi:hypothetical protein
MYQFSPWKKIVMEGKVRPFLIFILLSEYSKEIIFHASIIPLALSSGQN